MYRVEHHIFFCFMANQAKNMQYSEHLLEDGRTIYYYSIRGK